MPIDEAQKVGAMMLFGEKYGDEVRVLDIGTSRELCGGTHVARTGDIGFFRIVSEGGVAAGIRRVEAIAGSVALAQAQADRDRLARAAEALKAQPQEIDAKIAQVVENVKALEKEVARLKGQLAAGKLDDVLAAGMRTIKGVKAVAMVLDGADAGMLRESLDKVKERLGSGVALLASVADGKVSLIAGVTKDLTGKVKAGELVNFVAQQVGGKGGGRPDMAQAGGTNPRGARGCADDRGRLARRAALAHRADRAPCAQRREGEARREGPDAGGDRRRGRRRCLGRGAVLRGQTRPPAQSSGPPPADKPEALFVSMFPELQPHFHPEKLVAYVAARRGRTPARGGFTWKDAPGFGGPSVDIRFVKEREECALMDAAGQVLARFRFESTPDGGVLRLGDGKLTVTLKDPRDPAVRYWHPEREFKWTRRGGWRFKTPIADRPIASSDRDTSWSDDSSSASDGFGRTATAAGLAGLGGTFDGGGASAGWDGARGAGKRRPLRPRAIADSGRSDGDSGGDSGSDSGQRLGQRFGQHLVLMDRAPDFLVARPVTEDGSPAPARARRSARRARRSPGAARSAS